MTLTFSPERAVVITHTHATGQGHRSLGETDRQTEPIALRPVLWHMGREGGEVCYQQFPCDVL